MRANKDHDSMKARIRILAVLMIVISIVLVASLLSEATAPKSSDSKQYDLECLTELRKEPLKECLKEEDNAKD